MPNQTAGIWTEVAIDGERETKEWPVQEQYLEAKPFKFPPVRFPDQFPDIPATSPIHRLKELKRGWDGYDAEPIKLLLLHRAQKLWAILAENCEVAELPQVAPGREETVSFVWTQFGGKRLDIWMNAEKEFRAEWESETADAITQEGTAKSVSELIALVQNFLKG